MKLLLRGTTLDRQEANLDQLQLQDQSTRASRRVQKQNDDARAMSEQAGIQNVAWAAWNPRVHAKEESELEPVLAKRGGCRLIPRTTSIWLPALSTVRLGTMVWLLHAAAPGWGRQYGKSGKWYGMDGGHIEECFLFLWSAGRPMLARTRILIS